MTEHGAQDFGASLRVAREQRGLTLRQIADASKLSVRTLDALENNRIKILPGGIYRRAIVRVYAEEVGLDPEKTLRAFLAQHPDDLPETGTAAVVVTPPPSRSAWRSILGVMGALIPLIAGAWSISRSR